MPANPPLSAESAYLGSPCSFDVCVAFVRPEVSGRCADMLAEQALREPDGPVRAALLGRAQWWAKVAEVAAR